MKTYESTLMITSTLILIWLVIALLALIDVLPAWSTILTLPLSPFIGIGIGKLIRKEF